MKKKRSVQLFLFPAASGLALYSSPSPDFVEVRERDRRGRYVFRAELSARDEKLHDLSYVLSQVRFQTWARRYL